VACSAVSNVVTVTVNNLTSGSVGTNQTICYNGDPAPFTNTASATGDGTITYRWESSMNSATWSTISGANGTTYDVTTTLTQTMYYRRVAISTMNSVACERASAAITVTVPTAQLSATVAKTDITCNNINDGTITVSAPVGGYGTYEASIDNSAWFDVSSASSRVFTGLGPGEYTVSLRDKAFPVCVVTLGVQTITRPAALSATVNKTNITCNSANDGTITVSAPAGGYGTYQTSINNTTWFDVSSASPYVFSGLSNGTITVYIRDKAFPTCVVNLGNRVIYRPSVLTGTVVKEDVRCKNAADGIITINGASGGTHPEKTQTYQYRLVKVGDGSGNRPAQSSNTFTGLAPGTFDVYVIAQGVTPTCEVKLSTEIVTEPTLLVAAPAVTSNYNGAQLTCPNSSDGSIASNASGGTPPYQYVWQKNMSGTWTTLGGANATAQNVSGLNAGTYRVTVTDNKNCTVTQAVEIIPPAQTTIFKLRNDKYNGRDVSCFGSTNGNIIVTAQGGTGNLKFSRDNGTTWFTGGTMYQDSVVFTFSGLGAGTYNVIVQDVNGCNSDPQTYVLSNPPLLQLSSLTNSGPINAGESLTFTATIVGGTRFAVGNKYQYSWVKPRPEAQMPTNMVETANVNDVVTTFTIPVTTANDNGFNTNYILTITDANGCQSVLSVTPIIYPSTIIVSTAGNDLTGDGRTVNPLRTIQKAIDVADPGNTISVLSGTFNESPVVDKQLTINGTATTFLGTGKYFVYGTTSTITWGTDWPTSVWDNLGMNGTASSVIGTVMAKINSNSNANLWLIGNITWNATITVSKQLAIRGATASAGVPSYTGCDIVPPTTVTYTGAGADTVLFKFTGSTAKSVRDLILQIPNTGKFAEIPNGNSCNVDPVTNVRFEWDSDPSGTTSYRRIYGVTNGAFSDLEKFDVAKFVYDAEDNGYGSGRFVYGSNGPLPWNDVEIGWKAEDGGVDGNAEKIKTLEPMKGGVKLQNLVSNSRRPALNTGANYNDKWSMDFEAVSSQYLEANTTTEINGGDQKTLFVVFRPLDGDADQVIYKHGDQTNGMSVVQLADGRISLNVYNGATDATRESWIFEADATHDQAEFDNKVLIAQMYFNGNGTNNGDRRVGAALDQETGRYTTEVNHTGAEQTNGYVGSGKFSSTTLATPGTIGPANVVSVGTRSGSIYYASWDAGLAAPVNNSITTSGRALFYNGSIAEILILNTAAESSRDDAYCYLRNKYFGGSQGTGNGLNKRVIAGDANADDESVVAWPNPADDRVSIEAVIPTSGIVTVTLRDAVGRVAQVLYQDYVQGGTLLPVTADVRDLTSGAYIIHVNGAEGTINHSMPLIIRH
jgi:hypothetical protein